MFLNYEDLNQKEKEQAEFSYMCLMQELAEYEDVNDVAFYNRLLRDDDFKLKMVKSRKYTRNKDGDIFVD